MVSFITDSSCDLRVRNEWKSIMKLRGREKEGETKVGTETFLPCQSSLIVSKRFCIP